MNPTQKQFSLNRGASRKQFPISNVVLPIASWTPLVTNTYGVGGSFSYTNTISPGTPRLFLRIAQ